MPKRSTLVLEGKFKGLPDNIANQIGDPVLVHAAFPDCWPWEGMTVGSGSTAERPYGRAKTWTSKETLVHRIVFERTSGPIPRGLFVMHLCDHSLCCNPLHLKIGTHQENMQHMAASGRAADVRGLKNPKRILETCQVLEIREAYASGETAISIALRMNLGLGTVNALVLRNPERQSEYKHWPEVGGPMRPKHLQRKPHDKFGPYVEEMRLGYQTGATVNQIAEQWNATQGAVQKVLLGQTHADRPGPIFKAPLRWGTSLKGRRGSRSGDWALGIRRAYEQASTVNELAKMHEVTTKTIVSILSGKTHSQAGGPIFGGPYRYSDFRTRPKKSTPRCVRTEGIVNRGKFSGLRNSVARHIGKSVNRDEAMGYTGCWPWTGHKKAGYGGGRKLAHIQLYIWAKGPVAAGLVVMHLCNQRDCCNPDHLWAGDHAENNRYLAYSRRVSRLIDINDLTGLSKSRVPS